YSFAETAGLNVVDGRFFQKGDRPSFWRYDYPNMSEDSINLMESQQSLVLNKTAVEVLNLENPIGQIISNNIIDGTIIGVVEDFHEQSLHHEVAAVAFKLSDFPFARTLIQIEGNSLQPAIAGINKVYQQYFPQRSFDFEFADDRLQSLYLQEKQLGQLFLTFAILAILVANLGLLGIIAFAAQQRQKEISIRKILGCTISHIVNILSRDFLRLIFIAILIATPLSWYIMNSWLENFAYHIDIHWWVFAVAGMGAIGISLLVVGFQGVKTALINPVEILKND
ncbi:MAG: FtsX-like permease family protein, partial [Bacteroidota bacterium]